MTTGLRSGYLTPYVRPTVAGVLVAGLVLAAGCVATADGGMESGTAVASRNAGAGPSRPASFASPSRPAFGTYKDVTVHRADGSAALLTALDGPPTPVVRAMPAAQTTLTWAFATGECGAETWGGATAADFAAANVPMFTAARKHYIVSTGGEAGRFTCATDAGFDRFLARYESPWLDGVDFDIEAGQTPQMIDDLVARVARARDAHPRLRWSFTLATLGGTRAQSLGDPGVTTMKALRAHGLADDPRIVINLMVMDYGPADPVSCVVGADQQCDMGASAVKAAERLHDDWGVPWARIELTPMIGGNDSPGNTFTVRDVDTVSAFVRAKGLAGVRFWSLDRDTDCPPAAASNVCNTVGGVGNWGYATRFLAALGY